MKIYLLVLSFITFSLAACNDNEKKVASNTEKEQPADLKSKGLEDLKGSKLLKDILCQSWENKEDAEDAEGMASSDIEMAYRGYSFFNDGTVVKDPRGVMQIGKWELNETAKPIRILMSFENGEKQTEIPGEYSATRMTFMGKKGFVEMVARGFRHLNIKEDAFYPTNTMWMIKPASAETDEQIKQRLKACLHFFVLFYDDYVNVKAKSVSFVGLPSCYKWYAGGIMLQKEGEVDKKWVNCFYDRQQAMKAYQLAEKLVSKKYDWPKNDGGWMKMNLSVLRQMEKRIDSIN